MARRKATAGDDFYREKGLKTKKSEKREETESGRLAAYIINKIPKEFDIYEDNDINQVHIAHAIVETCGRYIKYCPQIGWLVYKEDEGRWTEKYAEAAVQKVITHFGNLLWEDAKETHAGEITFARSILSSAGINAIKNILKHDTIITVEREKFDALGDLLNCKGDYYNLRTGETRSCQPEDMFSKSTMCKPKKLSRDENGDWILPEISKRFGEFIDKVTSKENVFRRDLSFYILSYFGYCLTGDNGASFFVNFHGGGANGKSELLQLMLDLFGDYAAPLSKDIVIENKFQSQFDMASLPGIRLGMLIDAPKGRLNMDQLKSLISGDAINAKRKFHDDFVFKPVCKIAVGSNPKLKLNDTGNAVRRRIRMIPFDYIVPENERISHYSKVMLKEEAEEILSLLIWFAHRYYTEGEGLKAFPRCKTVDEASTEYLDSEDLIGRWITERTEAAEGAINPGVNTESVNSLYEDFKKWAQEEGVQKIMAKSTFGEYLGQKYQKKRISQLGDETHYLNIKLKYKTSPPLTGSG